MNNRVAKILDALRTGNPSGRNPYWRAMPIRRMTRLIVGTAVLASVIGFGQNLDLLGHRPLLHGFFLPLVAACSSAGVLIVRLKKPHWWFFALLVAAGFFFLATHAEPLASTLPGSPELHSQLLFNFYGICIGIIVASRFIMYFVTTESVAGVRMQTELALARDIQSTLVPPISFATPRFEVHGVSLPSTDMGGDLVDAIEHDGSLLAYVADVSGHGLPAGQLMGMLKTAMRLGVELRQPPVALLENADRVLPSLKQPYMYATVALLRFDGSMEAEYSLAGHPPILHYRKHTNDVARLALRQFPVGMFLGTRYTSARAPFSSGDLFVILTDGIIEAADEKDVELGLERVENLIAAHAAEPLPQIWEAIRGAAAAQGAQQDDQSALLIRAL